MYAEVKFKDRLKNLDEVEEICLPEAVHGEPKKLYTAATASSM